jgi:hypothetical protein
MTVKYECAYLNFTNYFNDKILMHLHRIYPVTQECAKNPKLPMNLYNALA